MFSSVLYFFFLSLLFSTLTAYTPTDYFLINCGSLSKQTSSDGRNWEGDAQSKFIPSNAADVSSLSTAAEQDPSVTQVPYLTARIFQHQFQFNYTFPLSPGPKFLRLYFYPATYSGLDKAKSFFSVNAGDDYTLLRNFSAFLTTSAQKPSPAYLIKEFIISVGDNQRLSITFSPSQNSYAFVNGIEIVSIPTNHYIGHSPVNLISDQQSLFPINNSTALETAYRFNVGGNDVPVTRDTGLFRAWVQDESYVFGGNIGFTPYRNVSIRYTEETPNYTAPVIVYTTFRSMGNLSLSYNLSWYFPVDSGFYYLLRLHFCEVLAEVTLENQRLFTIYINNQTAEEESDVIHWSGGNGIPVFRDYVVWVSDPAGRRRKQDLWLAMHPNLETKSEFGDVILNGLEIFKLNGTDSSLAGPNPEPVIVPPPPASQVQSSNGRRSSRAGPVIGGVIGGLVVSSILGYLIFRRMRKVKGSSSLSNAKSSWVPISHTSRSTKTSTSNLPSNLCRQFSLEELKSATGNFDDNFVIGKGGFGNVYKGFIDNSEVTVAIKRLNPSSSQGANEFQTEIIMLSKLRHLHLVSLIGYCDDNGEMILVYDYMANGTLRDHLYKTKNPPIPWKQRLEICIGAARGLHYLHTGAKYMIIHRDVKSTNILLDDKWVAKVADFGLSKLGPMAGSQTHVSTVVKGSLGYMDPEYYKRQQLTDKSDVYSFGVVLLEVLCARPAIIPGSNKEQVNLAEWAKYSYRKGTFYQIVDPNLRGEIATECLRKFAEVACSCLRDQGIQRPGMNDVVWGLEFALQLQDGADQDGKPFKNGGGTVPLLLSMEPNSTDEDNCVFSRSAEPTSGSRTSGTSTTSNCRPNSESVFSEIMNPTVR